MTFLNSSLTFVAKTATVIAAILFFTGWIFLGVYLESFGVDSSQIQPELETYYIYSFTVLFQATIDYWHILLLLVIVCVFRWEKLFDIFFHRFSGAMRLFPKVFEANRIQPALKILILPALFVLLYMEAVNVAQEKAERQLLTGSNVPKVRVTLKQGTELTAFDAWYFLFETEDKLVLFQTVNDNSEPRKALIIYKSEIQSYTTEW